MLYEHMAAEKCWSWNIAASFFTAEIEPFLLVARLNLARNCVGVVALWRWSLAFSSRKYVLPYSEIEATLGDWITIEILCPQVRPPRGASPLYIPSDSVHREADVRTPPGTRL